MNRSNLMADANLRTGSKLEGILVRCSNPNCQHRWYYKGRSLFYASCPFCRRNIKLNIRSFENRTTSLQSDRGDQPQQTAVDNDTPLGDRTS
jgi:hypothetical protein